MTILATGSSKVPVPPKLVLKKLGQKVTIHPDSFVCLEAEIWGDVTIGQGTIIHPCVQIIAEGGPIVIGEFNLIEERTVIYNTKDEESKTQTIGNHNVFEVGARCLSLQVGNSNVFEGNSFVCRDAVIGDSSMITAMCSLETELTLPNQSVVYADNKSRHMTDVPPSQVQQIEYLAKNLPKCHRPMKSLNKAPIGV